MKNKTRRCPRCRCELSIRADTEKFLCPQCNAALAVRSKRQADEPIPQVLPADKPKSYTWIPLVILSAAVIPLSCCGGLVGLMIFSPGSSATRAVDPGGESPEKIKWPDSIAARPFLAEWQNENAASAKYKGKRVVVYGYVSKISPRMFGGPEVQVRPVMFVEDGPCPGLIICNFDMAEQAEVNRLPVGKYASIGGTCNGLLPLSILETTVMLEGCHVIPDR